MFNLPFHGWIIFQQLGDPRSNFQDLKKWIDWSDVVLQMPATWLTLVDVHMWSTDRESKIQVSRIQHCRTIVSPIAYFTFPLTFMFLTLELQDNVG